MTTKTQRRKARHAARAADIRYNQVKLAQLHEAIAKKNAEDAAEQRKREIHEAALAIIAQRDAEAIAAAEANAAERREDLAG